MKPVPSYLSLILLLFFYSCHLTTSKVLVTRFNGEIIQISNPQQISCYKGDTVIVGIHCGYNTNPCDAFLCSIYRGKCPDNYELNFGDHVETGTYEKAIFLKEIRE